MSLLVLLIAIDELQCRTRSCYCLSLNKRFVVVVANQISILYKKNGIRMIFRTGRSGQTVHIMVYTIGNIINLHPLAAYITLW